MELCNTMMDDVAAAIGYSATNRLMVWFAGRNLYIPNSLTDDHILVKLIGDSAARRLKEEFGGMVLTIPKSPDMNAEKRRVAVWRLLKENNNPSIVIQKASDELGISRRRVEQIIQELKNAGLIGA